MSYKTLTGITIILFIVVMGVFIYLTIKKKTKKHNKPGRGKGNLIKKFRITFKKFESKLQVVNVYLYLGLFFFIIIFFFYLYFKIFSGRLNYIGIDLSQYLDIFIFLSTFLGLILSIKYTVINLNKRQKIKIFFIEKRFNNYIIITVYLICLMLFIGMELIRSEYGAPLPAKYTLYYSPNQEPIISNTIESIQINTCESINRYIDYVREDRLKCEVGFNYSENSNYRLGEIKVYKNLQNGTQYIQEIYKYPKNHKSYTYYIDFDDKPVQSYSVFMKFINKFGNNLTFYNWNLDEFFISVDDYEYKKKQRIPVFLALLTVSVFSVIAAVKNLRDLIEGSNDKQN